MRLPRWLPLLQLTIVCLLPIVFSSPSPSSKAKSNDGPVVALKAPPMGFMSWERFRCQVDCETHPDACINELLYYNMGSELVLRGYAQAGYTQVSIDDCWTQARDPKTNRLQANSTRFPHGIKWLADSLHAQGLKLGVYGDAGMETCGHYAGSQGYEMLDAQTFAEWGVDYLKLDGCNIQGDDDNEKYFQVYKTFGDALKAAASTRPIVFSCSWPAYIGEDESVKPYSQMYQEAGCNTWRNWHDVQNTWESLHGIIMHWADYWQDLQKVPNGAINDADMLLVGDHHGDVTLSLDKARLQMGFWAMIASPLFIGGDVRKIPPDYRKILLNKDVIAINQDPSLQQADCVVGCRGVKNGAVRALTSSAPVQVWSKSLQNGHSHALAFLNLHNDTSVDSIVHNYMVQGAIARCVDLWSDDHEQDVCAEGQGANTENWSIQPFTSNHKAVLRVEARQVAPASQRLLRIDYLCEDGEDCTSSTTT